MNKVNNQLTILLSLSMGVFLVGGTVWFFGAFLGEMLWDVVIEKSESKSSSAFATETTDKSQLTLLGDSFSGYSIFRNREFQNDLKKFNINFRYQEESSQSKRAEFLNKGKADLLVTTLDRYLKQKPQGKIVGLIDTTIGADAFVFNTKKYPNLNSLQDLSELVREKQAKGKKATITYAADSPSSYLFSLVLSNKLDALDKSDFQVKEVADASEAWKLLENSTENVAVGVISEPYVTKAREEGYQIALSSEDVPKSIVNVIVASDRLIESQPKKISQFLATYYRHLDANVREPSEIQKQIAEDANLSSDEAVQVLEGIDFFTSIEAQDWMNNGTLKRKIDTTGAVLVVTGAIEEVPQNTDDLFTPKFINKAVKNTKALIRQVRDDNRSVADRLAGQGTTIKIRHSDSASDNLEHAKETHKHAHEINGHDRETHEHSSHHDRDPEFITLQNGSLKFQENITFKSGSMDLTAESQEVLDHLSEKISEYNSQTVAVRIVGYTSRTGSEPMNKSLSLKRAEVVAKALRSRGLKHKFIADGKGSQVALPDISPQDPRQQRTEVYLERIN